MEHAMRMDIDVHMAQTRQTVRVQLYPAWLAPPRHVLQGNIAVSVRPTPMHHALSATQAIFQRMPTGLLAQTRTSACGCAILGTISRLDLVCL